MKDSRIERLKDSRMENKMKIKVVNDIVEDGHNWIFQNWEVLKYWKIFKFVYLWVKDGHDWIFQNWEVLKYWEI